MWSDEELDRAFGRLASPDANEPAEHEQVPFPLDNWLKLETQLDAAATKRLVRRRLWQLVGIEAAVLLLGLLAWHFWPWRPAASAGANQPAAPAPARQAEVLGAASPAHSTGFAKSSQAAVVPSSAGGSAPGHTQPGPAALPRAATMSRSVSAKAEPATAVAPAASPARATAARQAVSIAALTMPERWHQRESVHSSLKHRLNLPKRQALAALPPVASQHQARRSFPQKAASPLAHHQVRISDNHYSTAAHSVPGSHLLAKQRTPRLQLKQGPNSQLNAALASALAGQEDAEQQNSIAQPTAPVSNLAAVPAAEALLPARRSSLASQLVPLPASLAALPDPPTPELPPIERPRRLTLTLVTAPDVSTVRFTSVQRPDFTYGLLLDYRFSRWLRLRAGALQTTKCYRARRDDYDWEYSPGALRYNFDWVNGSCQVLDLPVSLRQDWWQRPTHTIYTSVGLSSYFLRREHYSYDAIGANGPFTWQKDLVNENRQFFSVLNLSFGYERRLAPRWSLQAEPYLKLPLTGIGYGEVKLVSGGILFGLSYGL